MKLQRWILYADDNVVKTNKNEYKPVISIQSAEYDIWTDQKTSWHFKKINESMLIQNNKEKMRTLARIDQNLKQTENSFLE